MFERGRLIAQIDHVLGSHHVLGRDFVLWPSFGTALECSTTLARSNQLKGTERGLLMEGYEALVEVAQTGSKA